MVRLAPRGRHVAYEPLPDLAVQLAEQFPTVEVRAAAVGEVSGRATFLPAPDPAYSSLKWAPPTPETEWVYPDGDPVAELEVPMERLDDLAEPIAFIKIDVEGGELRVLEGARRLLREHQPVVAFEHGLGCLRHGDQPGDVHGPLSEAGLAIFDMEHGGPYTRRELEAEVSRSERWFFYAADQRMGRNP